ncbi:JAB domain-containing protein [Klebsiella aerogenes]|uniref:JAB domain-containing protein n=1 Tax=Klebsiella aerogenes TaxID=548 RepID=UPI0039A69CA3
MACSLLKVKLSGESWENMGAFYLNNLNGILVFENLFFGAIAHVSLHPRIITQKALKINAAGAGP